MTQLAPLSPAAPTDPVREARLKIMPLIWQVLAFSMVLNILVMTSSFYMMQVFDRVLTTHNTSTLFYLTLIAVGALLLLGGLEFVRTRIMSRVGIWFEARLIPEGLQRAVEASLMGKDYRTEILRDLAALRNFFTGSGILNLFDLPWLFIYLLVVYLLHPVLGHITLLGALMLAGLAWLNDRVTHSDLKEAGTQGQRIYQRAEAAIRNAEAIDVMGMLKGLVHRWRSDNWQVQQLQIKAADRSGSIMAISKFARMALQIVVLAAGAKLALDRELTSGGMIAASIIISRALAPIESATGNWRYTLTAWQTYLRLQETFRRPLLRPEAMQLPPPKGHLLVEGVSYVVPGQKMPIIKGVSFEIRPGTVTALVGPSAAGKSTLARLCVGAYAPAYGNVRLDGADVFQWNREDFGQHVGYLPQDVELFAGTVRDNISRLLPSEPSDVVEAAQMVGAHQMILRLPQGYETEIGDGGILLSGGQRQRIGLARALFRKPQFVVLDEPNSSLDSEGEEALNQAILGLKQRNATVLLIGHRPSILTHVDVIIVLREGRIEMMGPRNEILARILPAQPQPAQTAQAQAPRPVTSANPQGVSKQ